jgi:hypothetical protein
MRTESPPSATFVTVLRDGKRRPLPHNSIVAGISSSYLFVKSLDSLNERMK